MSHNDPQEGPDYANPVTLAVSKNSEFTLKITNETGLDFIFCPIWNRGLFIYHESQNGVKTQLTGSLSAFEEGLLSPFQTVNLSASSTFTLQAKPFVVPRLKIDRGEMLKKEGTIYAVVSSLSIDSFDERYRKEAKRWNLLETDMRSNSMKVPLDP